MNFLEGALQYFATRPFSVKKWEKDWKTGMYYLQFCCIGAF
jgi:hypothetical protein